MSKVREGVSSATPGGGGGLGYSECKGLSAAKLRGSRPAYIDQLGEILCAGELLDGLHGWHGSCLHVWMIYCNARCSQVAEKLWQILQTEDLTLMDRPPGGGGASSCCTVS